MSWWGVKSRWVGSGGRNGGAHWRRGGLKKWPMSRQLGLIARSAAGTCLFWHLWRQRQLTQRWLAARQLQPLILLAGRQELVEYLVQLQQGGARPWQEARPRGSGRSSPKDSAGSGGQAEGSGKDNKPPL